MSIGQVIRALRLERGLTQETLALEANVATSNVSRIENGQRQPTSGLLQRLAQALGTSVSRIYLLAEEMNSPQDRGINVHYCLSSPPLDTSLVQQLAAHTPNNDAPLLLRYFRELDAENRQLVMEQVKLLRRLQRQREMLPEQDSSDP